MLDYVSANDDIEALAQININGFKIGRRKLCTGEQSSRQRFRIGLIDEMNAYISPCQQIGELARRATTDIEQSRGGGSGKQISCSIPIDIVLITGGRFDSFFVPVIHL